MGRVRLGDIIHGSHGGRGDYPGIRAVTAAVERERLPGRRRGHKGPPRPNVGPHGYALAKMIRFSPLHIVTDEGAGGKVILVKPEGNIEADFAMGNV